MGTGFLLAGYQFSITDLFGESVGVRKVRAFLTWCGMAFVVVGLGLLAVHMKGLFWALILWFVGLAFPLICAYLALPMIVRFARPDGFIRARLNESDAPSDPANQSEALLTEIRDALRSIVPSDAVSERGGD